MIPSWPTLLERFHPAFTATDSSLRLAWKKLGQATCRHGFVLVILRHRLFLRCTACGKESAGYEFD